MDEPPTVLVTPIAVLRPMVYWANDKQHFASHSLDAEWPRWATIFDGLVARCTVSSRNGVRQYQHCNLLGDRCAFGCFGPELARRLADILGGQYYYLHAPILGDNPTVRDLLLAEPAIQDTLNRVRKVALALVGIGTTEPGANSFVRAGHLSKQQLATLRTQGAVGETCGQHFDINGSPAGLPINQHVIGIELEAVRQIPQVFAVACGLNKARAIYGALRGGYINVLATDDGTAQAVLDHHAQSLTPRRVAAPM